MSLPPTLESQSGNNPALETSFDMVGWGLIVSVGKMKLIDAKSKLSSDITVATNLDRMESHLPKAGLILASSSTSGSPPSL